MRECYHEACDSADPNMLGRDVGGAFSNLKEDSPQMDFLMSTVRTIVGMAMEVSGAKCRFEPNLEAESKVSPEDDQKIKHPRVVPLRGNGWDATTTTTTTKTTEEPFPEGAANVKVPSFFLALSTAVLVLIVML